jgi:hypothetical protein
MLLALAFLLLSLALGFLLVKLLRFFDSLLETFALGAPVGIVLSSFLVLGLEALARGFSDYVFYFSLAIIALVLIALCSLYRKALRPGRLALRKAKLTAMPKEIAYVILLVYGVIAFVLLTSLYMYNGALYCLGPSICSDLLYHIGIGNSLIYSGFPPQFPYTIGAVNVFPFINDFYSALLIKYGLGLVGAAIVPYLILFLSAVVFTTEFAYAVLKSKFATLAAMLVFWFGSDFIMAFILYPLSSMFPSFPNNLAPLSYFMHDYGINATGISALIATSGTIISGWTSIIYQNLLPQRGFVLALPLGISLIYFAYQLTFSRKRFTRWQMLLIGAIAGLMPLTHPITLLVLAFVGAFVFLKLFADRKRRREVAALAFYVLLPAVILALPQALYMASQPPVPGRYHFVYNVYYRTGSGIVSTIISNIVYVPSFWIDLVGLPLLLAIIGYKLAKKEARQFLLPFIAIWIMLTIFSFELDGSDANKLFLYIFLMLSIFSGYVFANLYKRKLGWKLVAIALVLANMLNFPVVYLHWAGMPFQWISSSEINASLFALHNTSSSSLFAVSDYASLQNTVTSLGGRRALLAMYPYTEIDEYTYPLSQLIEDNDRIFATGNCTLIRSLNVSYIYLLSNNTNDTSPFANQNFTEVFSQPDPLRGAVIHIYKALC